jgi:hypothetical protein
MRQLYIIILINLAVSGELLGQNSYRPGLFFREDWKETPAEIPLNQNHVANTELTVQLYGVGMDNLKKSHHEKPIDDPYYVWSGLCLGNWMVSLKHKTKNVDLTEFAKIKIRTKQSGLRELRISLKLANGDWLVSDQSAGISKDWKITEFNIQDIVWHILDAERIAETGLANDPDISNVEEIGFTDLMPGGESNACSRLDWIEVYGKPILR